MQQGLVVNLEEIVRALLGFLNATQRYWTVAQSTNYDLSEITSQSQRNTIKSFLGRKRDECRKGAYDSINAVSRQLLKF